MSMEFGIAFNALMSILETPIVLMGFTFSLFEVIIYSFILGILILFIGGMLK